MSTSALASRSRAAFEVKAQGNTLGPVGSRIVVETIIGQLHHDPTSYLRQESWSPGRVRLPTAPRST